MLLNKPTLTTAFDMVLSSSWLEFEDLAQDPLVRREPVLLHVTNERLRVWRHKNTSYTTRNIKTTVPYGGGSVMVVGFISHYCKLYWSLYEEILVVINTLETFFGQ